MLTFETSEDRRKKAWRISLKTLTVRSMLQLQQVDCESQSPELKDFKHNMSNVDAQPLETGGILIIVTGLVVVNSGYDNGSLP